MSPRGRGRPSREEVLRTLDRAIDDLHSVGGLPLPAEAEAIWEGIWYEEAHHSTAIEGNTLVLKEIERLLRDGRAVGDRPAKGIRCSSPPTFMLASSRSIPSATETDE